MTKDSEHETKVKQHMNLMLTDLVFYTINPKEMSLLIIAKVLGNALDRFQTHFETIKEHLQVSPNQLSKVLLYLKMFSN